MSLRAVSLGFPGITPVNRPLVAYIAHSFGFNRTIFKWPIASLAYNTGTGALAVTCNIDVGQLATSTPELLKIDGMGAPWDTQSSGYFKMTSLAGGVIGVGNTVTYNGTIATGLAPTGTYLPAKPGLGQVFSLGAGGPYGGYGPGWLALARAIMGNAFAVPPSYCFGIGGGRIVGAGSVASDQGFPGWVSVLLAYLAYRGKPLPQYCVVDLGINDPLGTLATMKSQALAGFNALIAAGIKPIAAPIAGFASGGSYSANQVRQTRAYNFWLQELAQAGKILTFSADRRLQDPTSTSGFALLREIPSNDVHPTANGHLDIARAFSDTLNPIFPAIRTTPINNGDAFDATYNPTGSITGNGGATLAGVFPATVAQTTLTSSNVQYGGVLASWGGAAGPTIAVSARTDKNADGSTINGNECVVNFPAAAYGAGISQVVMYVAIGGQFLNQGVAYNAGDIVQAEVEIAIDSAGLSGSPGFPQVQLQQHDTSGLDVYNTVFGPTPGQVAAQMDSSAPGLLAGTYQITGPVFQTAPNSSYLGFIISLPVSGTVTAPGITYRLRGAGLRKVDPLFGEPF